MSEAKAQEELRRKDPVKRTIWAAVLLVSGVLVWCSSLQVRSLLAKGDVARLEAQIKANTNSYTVALTNQRRLADARLKMNSLRQLAANRFLQAPVLNALQETVINDVQLTRFKTEQTYVAVEAAKAFTNANNQPVPARAATVTEKVVVTLEARDTGVNPGDQVTRFKQSVASSDLFQQLLGKTNEVKLASLSAPQVVAGVKPFVAFSLECRLPEKVR